MNTFLFWVSWVSWVCVVVLLVIFISVIIYVAIQSDNEHCRAVAELVKQGNQYAQVKFAEDYGNACG